VALAEHHHLVGGQQLLQPPPELSLPGISVDGRHVPLDQPPWEAQHTARSLPVGHGNVDVLTEGTYTLVFLDAFIYTHDIIYI